MYDREESMPEGERRRRRGARLGRLTNHVQSGSNSKRRGEVAESSTHLLVSVPKLVLQDGIPVRQDLDLIGQREI